MHLSGTSRSLAEVRREIDRIDRELVALLPERGRFVRRAAALKRDPAEVPAPARVEAVIAQVREAAHAAGLDEAVAEATWRAMVGAFIAAETRFHEQLHPPPGHR